MKKIILATMLVLGVSTFAANGTSSLQGNRQPNGQTRMEANGGICVTTGTTTRGNAGSFLGTRNGIGYRNGFHRATVVQPTK
jgi:hypothetical protein